MALHRTGLRSSSLVALAVLVAAGASGCAGSTTKGAGNGSGSSTLTVNASFVLKDLDPGQVYEGTGNMVVHSLYDTLVTFDGSDISKPVPDLAKSYSAATDGKTFTFTLDPKAKFADGTKVTSADVLFSLNRLKNLKGSAAAIVQDLSFAAPDAETVVVTSSQLNPNVPTILSEPFAGILNSAEAKKHGGSDAADAASADSLTHYLDSHAIGSGPYQIQSFDAASTIVLTANPKYWRTAPSFGRVVIKNTTVQNEKLTMSKLPDSEIALDLTGNALTGLPNALQVSGSPDSYYQLRVDADPAVSKITSNADWAAALRASINYQGIAELLGPSGKAAAGIVPPAFAGSLPESEAQKQDLPKAKELLAKSGVADSSVQLLYPAITYGGIDLGTIAAKVQSDAAEAGIKIELDPAPISSFLEQRKGQKVALSFSPQSLDYPVAASIVADLMPGGATAKAAGWTAERAKPEVVAAADAVLGERESAKQVAALQTWQKLMIEDSPYITLVYNSDQVVASPNLKNAVFTAAGWSVDLASITTS